MPCQRYGVWPGIYQAPRLYTGTGGGAKHQEYQRHEGMVPGLSAHRPYKSKNNNSSLNVFKFDHIGSESFFFFRNVICLSLFCLYLYVFAAYYCYTTNRAGFLNVGVHVSATITYTLSEIDYYCSDFVEQHSSYCV